MWVCMGRHDCGWVKWDECTKARGETAQKEAKWLCNAYFAMHGHDEKYSRVHVSQNMHYTRVMGRNTGKERAAHKWCTLMPNVSYADSRKDTKEKQCQQAKNMQPALFLAINTTHETRKKSRKKATTTQ